MKQIFTYLIALVWVVNGLYCKVLNQVPRHQEIVGRILGEEYAPTLTILIGISEIVMAVWVLTRYRSRLSALAQIGLVATMNIIETILVPDLLLWGHVNAFFALCFIGVVYYHEFVLGQNSPS
ncbi:MAG: DoxX-like family protein [Saprospiraceae bacterium]